MPEEIEVPTEHLHEAMNEAAEHEGGSGFNMRVALSSAIIAVLAAISALMAGHHANEALLDEISASNTWSYFQSKSIKEAVLKSKVDLISALGKKQAKEDQEKLADYGKEKKEIQEKAEEKEKESAAHLAHHVILARAVTMFQIAIALSAISMLTRKKKLWWGSLALGAAGAFFLVTGLI